MNSFIAATVGLLVFIVVLMVFMPVSNLLISLMVPVFGASTIFIMGTIPVVLIVSALYVFIQRNNEIESFK